MGVAVLVAVGALASEAVLLQDAGENRKRENERGLVTVLNPQHLRSEGSDCCGSGAGTSSSVIGLD